VWPRSLLPYSKVILHQVVFAKLARLDLPVDEGPSTARRRALLLPTSAADDRARYGALNRPRISPIDRNMTGTLVLPYLVLLATLMKALLVKANLVPPSCARCGETLERRRLGDPVCRCRR
jgi:hypothetical protein